MRSARGNALFLILIAVALFAALSYAVTQSGRGGAGVDKEQNLITAAQIVQYGAALETAVTRMVLTGTALGDLEFCSTGGANDSSAFCIPGIVDELCTTGDNCLFSSTGGGAIAQSFSYASPTPIVYTAPDASALDFQLGTTANDGSILFNSIPLDLCEEINDGLGLTNPPVQDSGLATHDAYPGQYSGCYETSGGGAYIYFQVLGAR